MNEAIRASELRVIGENGEQIGVLSRQEALKAAEDAGLDLVEISPAANPPVAKVIDWGKYQYQKTKELQKARAKSRPSEMKQIRIGLKIGANDLDIKLKKVRKFLEEGHKVRLTVVFKGREMAHKDLGFVMIKKVQEILGDEIVSEQQPSMAGRNLSITVRSK
ncbi:MAG: translation initiation factor IF-3 [Candidatus Saccharibacteria bacterium]|nr:translation initiation factor IF-3 [Candidatus Saccharibacteria bacterium]